MRNSFLMAGMFLLAASCSNERFNEVVSGQTEQAVVPVTIQVSDFAMAVEDMSSDFQSAPRATTRGDVQDAANFADVKVMVLAFYDAAGNEAYKSTQVKGDASNYTTFGHFSCNLPIGHYTMVVIGRGHYDGDEFTLTSPTVAGYSTERARETFCKTQEVTVTNDTPLNLSVTLNRIVAELKVVSTDNRSAGVAKIRTTYGAGGKSFNPSTGFATSNTGFQMTNTPSSAVGAPISVFSFVFLEGDAQSMTITLEALDSNDQVLFTKVINDVPMQRNKKTTLRGAIFTADPSSASFSFSTDWLPEETVDF